jgi:hypothetical protein
MDILEILGIIGWLFLIMSWTVPYLIEDKQTRKLLGVALASVAVGIFLAGMLVKYQNYTL